MKDWGLEKSHGNLFLVHYHRDQLILDPYVGERNWYYCFPMQINGLWECTYCKEKPPKEMMDVALLANVHDGWIK